MTNKIVKAIIFFFMFLLAFLIGAPVIIWKSVNTPPYNSTSLFIRDFFQDNLVLYIIILITLSLLLGILFFFFPTNFKAAEDIANKDVYDKKDIHQPLPLIIIIPFFVFVLLVFLFFSYTLVNLF